MAIVTHLSTYSLEVGKPVGLVTRAVDAKTLVAARANNTMPSALRSTVAHAEMIVLSPDGSETELRMHDDGLHNDVAAGDGVFGATFVPHEAGSYVWRAQISGSANGAAFQRSTQHYVRVAREVAALNGRAELSMKKNRLVASIGADVHGKSSAPVRVHAYAELWRGGKGVAWAMSIVNIVNGAVELTYDSRWLRAPGVDLSSGTFELRNVYISEMNGFVPLSHVPIIKPKQTTHLALQLGAMWNKLTVSARMFDPVAIRAMEDDSMWFGERPQWIEERAAKATQLSASASDVLLVHGYCSSDNPFATSGHSWNGAKVFGDYNQNLPTDEFAQRVATFAEGQQLSQYALIGHSQGGLVGAHLADRKSVV